MVTTDVVDVSLIDVERTRVVRGEYTPVCAHAVHAREHEIEFETL